jgi:hypothetical protein
MDFFGMSSQHGIEHIEARLADSGKVREQSNHMTGSIVSALPLVLQWSTNG